MAFAASTVRAQRWLLVAMLVGSPVLILPSTVEPFMLPKMTFLVFLGVAVAALGAARGVWTRRLSLPVSPVTFAVAVFALALVVTTTTSASPSVSLIGFYSRYTGLVPYLTFLLVFVVALSVLDMPFLQLLRRAALVGLGLVVSYGLLQAGGLDPIDYRDLRLGETFSFLGNTNFSAAWAGAVSALALTTVFDSAEHKAWRAYATVLTPLTLLYAILTGTSQGPVVAAVALGWAGLLLTTAHDSPVRAAAARRRGVAVAATGVAAVAVLAAVLAALPFLRAQLDQALVERPAFWVAAVRIFIDHPLLGTGLDTYAHHFLAYRPASHALANATATTDAPHSVPLGMFSNGGLLLGLSYLVVVALVAFAVVRGALRLQGPARIALAGFGGVWLGYQVQSLISFDVPPLALLHWLSAAVVVTLAAPPRWREITLPGQPAAQRRTRKGKARGAAVVPTSTRVLHGMIALAGVVALWLAAYPLRADLVAASAAPLTASGRFDEAVERFARAAALNPAEPTYPFLAGRAHDAAGRHAEALEAAAEAARRDPGTVEYALFAAEQAQLAGRQDEARRWFLESVERDPRDPPVLNAAAAYLRRVGDVSAAERLLERSVGLRTDPDALVQLAQVRVALDDVEGAREVLEQALALEPGNQDARAVLEELNGS